MRAFARSARQWVGEQRSGTVFFLSLRATLIAGFGIVLVLLASVGTLAIMGERATIADFNKLLAVDIKMADLSQKSVIAMMKARRYEKDFLMLYREFGFQEAKSRYVTLLQANLADARLCLAEMNSLTLNPTAKDQIRIASHAIGNYENSFLAVVVLHGQLGFIDTGLQGQFRDNAHQIEALLDLIGEPQLMVDLLSLRRREKDYLLRGRDTDNQATHQALTRFRKDLASAVIKPEQRVKLAGLADLYQLHFEKYVKTDQQIDLEKRHYLAAVQAIDPHLEKLLASARAESEAARDNIGKKARQTETMAGIVGLGAIVLGMLVAWLVSSRIAQLEQRLLARTADLEKSEEHFRQLTDLSADWYWEQDQHFRFTEMSGGMFKKSGVSGHSYIGKTRWEMPIDITPDEWASHKEVLDRHQKFTDFEYKIEFDHVGARWFSISGEPLSDPDGRFAGYRGIGKDITERKQTEERIKHLSLHDVLTGLPNRTLLQDRLTQALAYAARYQHAVWVVFIDLDGFKLINDTLGHKMGDLVLAVVAQRLQSAMRESDTVARLGGDEFILVLPEHPDGQSISNVVQRIMGKVAEPLLLQGQEVFIGCSVGVAAYPHDGADANTLVDHADAAMYRAKQSGRNNFQFYSLPINEGVLSGGDFSDAY